MNRRCTIAVVLLGTMSITIPLAASPQGEAQDEAYSGKGFAVVELFTSEGCNSCPPADKVLSQIHAEAERTNTPVYAIGWHVDYWDRLGWPDRFGSREYSLRQRNYARRLNSNVYTPQMIVNGQNIVYPAQSLDKATEAAEVALRLGSSANIDLTSSLQGNEVTVTYTIDPLPFNSQLALVVVEGDISSKVTRGENTGRTLMHTSTVRAVEWVSSLSPSNTVTIQIPDDVSASNASVIAFIQQRSDLRIVAAAHAKL